MCTICDFDVEMYRDFTHGDKKMFYIRRSWENLYSCIFFNPWTDHTITLLPPLDIISLPFPTTIPLTGFL